MTGYLVKQAGYLIAKPTENFTLLFQALQFTEQTKLLQLWHHPKGRSLVFFM